MDQGCPGFFPLWENVMLGHRRKANTFCIVKIQNGTRKNKPKKLIQHIPKVENKLIAVPEPFGLHTGFGLF